MCHIFTTVSLLFLLCLFFSVSSLSLSICLSVCLFLMTISYSVCLSSCPVSLSCAFLHKRRQHSLSLILERSPFSASACIYTPNVFTRPLPLFTRTGSHADHRVGDEEIVLGWFIVEILVGMRMIKMENE